MSGGIEGRFMFAQGLAKPITAPGGTLARWRAHVAMVERRLGLVAERFRDNPPHWRPSPSSPHWLDGAKLEITDEDLCDLASTHNEWLDSTWRELGEWSETPPTGNTETLTNDDLMTVWQGFQPIEVPIARWSRDYYRERMERLYDVLRGRERHGVHWGAKPLTPEQAAGVVWLLAVDLGIDVDDQRLEAPQEWVRKRTKRGMRTCLVQMDELQPSDAWNGEGYRWCEKCGAVDQDSSGRTGCPRRKCPIREEEEE